MIQAKRVVHKRRVNWGSIVVHSFLIPNDNTHRDLTIGEAGVS